MAWIELHQGLRDHKKMFKCAEALSIDSQKMIGTLVCLWLWALDNAQSGSLAGVSNQTIARVCGWPEKKSGKLVDAMQNSGWLDYDESNDCLVIHDWYDYAGKLMERRENDRKRKGRAKDSGENSSGIPAESRGKSHATVPLPYPNPTICGGGDESARERFASDADLARIGLEPGQYPFVTNRTIRDVIDLANGLFSAHAGEDYPTPGDYKRTFQAVCRFDGQKTTVDKDAAELLRYAFEQAESSGLPGQWRYVNGILGRLAARDIHTRAEAEAFDEERPDKEK